MIIGSAEFIEKCRRRRKILGGGMRQVGLLAAAGLYALKTNLGRLSEDHVHASYLAKGLDRLACFEVDMKRVQTNIVLANVVSGDNAEQMLAKMKEVGVLAVPFGPKTIRFVTHLDIDQAGCAEALDRLQAII
jgi:threonine aldolase